MKKTIVIGWMCISVASVYAQTNTVLPSNDIIIGRNFNSNIDIKAKEWVFPDRIDSWYIDDSTRMMTLQMRGLIEGGSDRKSSGNIIQFDLSNKYIVWNQNIDYLLSTMDQYDNVLIKTTQNKSSSLSYTSGEELWNSKNTICYVNPKLKVGVGYRYSTSSGSTNTLEGIDLDTGKSIWKREIKNDYHLSDFIQLNDSVLLILADGLHTIHLKTGQGWDYRIHTGKKDYTGAIVSNLFSITINVLLQSESEPEITTGYDLLTDVLSNVLVDSTGIYMADKESIFRIDYNGNLVWKTGLPKKMVSKSSVFFKNNQIYLVNSGFATYNNQIESYGRPFIAVFNKDDGKKDFLNILGSRNDQISSYQFQGDTLYLLSKNKLFKYSLKDGSELWENRFNTDSLGELNRFAGANMYIDSDSLFYNPMLTDSSNLYVFNNRNQILVLTNQLDFKTIIPENKIANLYLDTNDYKFLETGNSTIIIDKKNKPVAGLDVSGYALLRGNKLYEAQGNSFVEVDMDDILMKKK